ncbi:MAG: Ig-like domain-containing protein [Candidatus Methanoplasma sp.]|nr:Ig-like domain-containing protein [Candidatus Methanoplasma sp.]
MLKSSTAVTGVTLNTNSVILGVGEKERITATVFPSDATIKNVKWLSSNESVATVDENGVVTAVGVGQITISVTTGDRGYRAFCTVKVLAEVTHTTGVVLDKESLTLPIYRIEQITKTIYPSDAAIKNVKWSSSNRTVASVDAAGKVIGITPGTAVITVTTADGGFTATCVVTVVAPVKNVSVDKSSVTLKEGHGEEITATVSPASATNKDVTWSSSDESVASVVDGFVTAIRKGTATITAKTVEGDFEAFCLLIVEGQQVIVT